MTNTAAQFARIMSEALDLIAKHDPVRFCRVKRQMVGIINSAGIVGATYATGLKVCAVNLRSFVWEGETPNTIKLLASTLVYEATFGHLLRHVSSAQQNSDRFYHVCRKEAQRFMLRLGMTQTPWDSEEITRLGQWEGFKFWLVDTIAGQLEATKDSTTSDKTGTTGHSTKE